MRLLFFLIPFSFTRAVATGFMISHGSDKSWIGVLKEATITIH